MGKKGSSWLAAVKRVFSSPSKENNIGSRKQETEHGEGRRRENRTWLFRKSSKPEMNLDEKMQSIVPTEVVRLVVLTREDRAAIAIQTTFRGFLARRALKALRGLVKLQALIRGHNVRKQAKTTLRCMQALVRVQSQMLEETRSCINHGREGISILSDDWEEKHRLVEEEFVKAILHDSHRQFQFFPASSKQSSKRRLQSFGNEGEMREQISHIWMGRASTDQRLINPQRFRTNLAPSTPTRTRPTPQLIRSASPRYSREEKYPPNPITSLPNFMTPTESTKAKSRWHSAPRQRPMTPEKERGLVARKRLTYKSGFGGVSNDNEMIMSSPSFMSVCGVVEEGSNYSSCCTTHNESLVGRDNIVSNSLKSDDLIKKWYG